MVLSDYATLIRPTPHSPVGYGEIGPEIKKAAQGDFDLFTALPTRFCAVGGGKRDRTADLLHAMQALSQLSYTPRAQKHCYFLLQHQTELASPRGFEPLYSP